MVQFNGGDSGSGAKAACVLSLFGCLFQNCHDLLAFKDSEDVINWQNNCKSRAAFFALRFWHTFRPWFFGWLLKLWHNKFIWRALNHMMTDKNAQRKMGAAL